MSDEYNPLVPDAEVQAAFDAAVAAGRDFGDFNEIADFSITTDGGNVFDLVPIILRAGARMEFTGGQVFVVEDSDASYYFVGRKPAVIEKIRGLAGA